MPSFALDPALPESRERPILLHWLQSQPLRWVWFETLMLLLLIGILDYVTGYDITVSLLYFAPILLMVWCADKKSAFFVVWLCALVWWWADVWSGHPYHNNWHQIWETFQRIAYFHVAVIAGSAVRSRLDLLEKTRGLEHEIIRISEREQQRIGRDLHDGLCQYFAAIGCAAGALKGQLEKTGSERAAGAAEIEKLIMDGVHQARSLARGLFPVQDDAAGLRSALQELAGNVTKLQNVRCRFECPEPEAIRDHARATHLFRIAQEAVSNAIRHGQAAAIVIELARRPEANADLTLAIADDGVGLPAVSRTGPGLGLSIMRYRARTLGGTLTVEPGPTGGTVVACTFQEAPLEQPDEQAAA